MDSFVFWKSVSKRSKWAENFSLWILFAHIEQICHKRQKVVLHPSLCQREPHYLCCYCVTVKSVLDIDISRRWLMNRRLNTWRWNKWRNVWTISLIDHDDDDDDESSSSSSRDQDVIFPKIVLKCFNKLHKFYMRNLFIQWKFPVIFK